MYFSYFRVFLPILTCDLAVFETILGYSYLFLPGSEPARAILDSYLFLPRCEPAQGATLDSYLFLQRCTWARADPGGLLGYSYLGASRLGGKG